MKRPITRGILASACALALLVGSGCAVHHGDFTVVSNKLVDVSKFELGKADRKKGIVGEDIVHIVVLFQIGGIPTVEAAIDDALEKGNGDVLTDASIDSWFWYIPYIYGQTGWRVKGDVVKTRKN